MDVDDDDDDAVSQKVFYLTLSPSLDLSFVHSFRPFLCALTSNTIDIFTPLLFCFILLSELLHDGSSKSQIIRKMMINCSKFFAEETQSFHEAE